MLNRTDFRNIAEIDARLNELETEKSALIALREQLQNDSAIAPAPISYSPEQKIAIFRGFFRGRSDIFANRWQLHKTFIESC